MKTYAIDFETFYDKDFGIKIQGSAGYIEDPRFDAYLLSVACDDGYTYVGDPKNFDWTMLTGHIVVAHNAAFDEHIFLRYFCDGDPAEFHCTADLAAFCGYPRSLEGVMRTAFGKRRDKTVRDRMKGQDRKYAAASPENRAYALEDAVDCLRVWQTFSPAWPESERRISRLNREMGWDGVCVNVPYVEECIKTLDMEFEIRKKDIPWAETAALGSPIELRKFLTLKGIPVPESTAKNDEDFQEWLDTYAGQVPFVRGIGDLRSIRKTQASFRTLLNRRRADGSFPYSKFYFGAHTGRFAGAGGFNMENLPRDDKFNTNMRAAFIPRPGCAFVIADYSQIEPRCIFPGTPVLTASGYKKAVDLTQVDLVWDGQDFVHHAGVIFKKGEATHAVNQTRCTADHFVYTGDHSGSPAEAAPETQVFSHRNPSWREVWLLARFVGQEAWCAFRDLLLRLRNCFAGVMQRPAQREINPVLSVRPEEHEAHEALQTLRAGHQ